ncbi:MAG TPA: hypothetical protein VK988_18930 [Acidimicrobiales bacterium]|nr:hypothetical protein [Acidimicrobiales bacterium]
MSNVAEELGCDWHTVNDAVLAYGEALLEADTNRVGNVVALGLDETLFCREGPWRRQLWCPSVVAVGGPGQPAQLIDIVSGRSAATPSTGSTPNPTRGRRRSAGGCSTCPAPSARSSPTACPTPSRSPTRSTW